MESRLLTDSLMGKYLRFSIIRTSLTFLGFTMYVLFALTFHIPVAIEPPQYLIRHKSPQAYDIILTLKYVFGGVN